jgi:acetyl esterase/lipase
MHAEHEGKGYADFFTRCGFHCFVCTYRVDDRARGIHPAPLEDGLVAVASVRARAVELGFSPEEVGVIGSSAGGHLAAHVSSVSIQWGREYRPNWAILCYPVIALFGPAAHLGSRANLIGSDANDQVAAELSPHTLVNSSTPPTFLWHTVQDGAVPLENSLLYAEALRREGVGFELHITENGGHGLGLEADFDWADRAFQWLVSRERS